MSTTLAGALGRGLPLARLAPTALSARSVPTAPTARSAPTAPTAPSGPTPRARPTEAAALLALADGRCVRLRAVRAHDAEALQALVVGLSPRSRRLRFHGAIKRLPDALLHRLVELDMHGHAAWVAEGGCHDGARRLVADVRYVRSTRPAPHCHEAEFAVMVADGWQGLGLGRRLLLHMAQHAREHGLTLLSGRVLAENTGMLQLMQSLGAYGWPLDDEPGIVDVKWWL